MTETSATLDAARAAFARRDWAKARDGFLAAAEEGPLSTDDLHRLSQCSWWLGEVGQTFRHLEEAHRRFLDEGDQASAAMTALELGITHLLRGDEPVGSGWVGRAGRLAEEIPEHPIHGYLTFVLEVEDHLGAVDPSGAMDAARRVTDIGRRCGDPTLVACGLNAEGRVHLKAGRVSEGLALLDEAMVSVLAGEVDADWTGNLYCNTISACHELGDFRRMARWTEATERWLETLAAAVLFAGICRVHRAQLLTLTGDWDRAEREALRVCEELEGISVANVAEAWYEVGEVRRRRGDLPGAEEAYRAAHEHGRDPQPGLALLRLAQGRTATAVASVRSALLAAGDDRLAQARLCAAQVEIATAANEPEVAREASDALSEIAAECASPGLNGMAATARGAVLLAEGKPDQALLPLRQGSRAWRDLDVPYEAARTEVLLARAYQALGDAEAAERELDAASAVFDRLGASLDGAEFAKPRGGPPRPGGLSSREVEVLRLVADGRSNAEIAEALFISRKTVARHLSNIFTKLGVTSRTEAARYAFDHGLIASHPG